MSAGPRVALAPFLIDCPAVVTLGLKPGMEDYSREERDLLLNARRVYFPTPRFSALLEAIEIPTFPSAPTYRIRNSRLRQAALLAYLNVPHPRTRCCFGHRQVAEVRARFAPPLLVMGDRVTGRPPEPVLDVGGLNRAVGGRNPVIIQEFRGWRRRVRLVTVNFRVLAAAMQTDGAEPDRAWVPVQPEDPRIGEPCRRTDELIRRAGLDEIALEWGEDGGGWCLVGMAPPMARLETPGGVVHRHRHICALITAGEM